MTERDRSPIDQRWIQDYCDTLLRVATGMPTGPIRDAIMHRIGCCMDLLEAWQTRKNQ